MNFRNPDGGFGESTLACLDDGQRGRGASTRTQTVRVLEFVPNHLIHNENNLFSRFLADSVELGENSVPYRLLTSP
jgi:hypothetical protein